MDEGTDAKDILENRLLPLRRGLFLFVTLNCKYSKSQKHISLASNFRDFSEFVTFCDFLLLSSALEMLSFGLGKMS